MESFYYRRHKPKTMIQRDCHRKFWVFFREQSWASLLSDLYPAIKISKKLEKPLQQKLPSMSKWNYFARRMATSQRYVCRQVNAFRPTMASNFGNLTFQVKEAADIDKLQFGGCEIICDQPLPCGHLCKGICHTANYMHQECLCSGSL